MFTLLALLSLAASPAPTTLTIREIAPGDSPDLFYLGVAAGDLDGDGVADDAVVRLQCDKDRLGETRYVLASRDVATGQSSGRRTHKPIRLVKEWGAATPQLREIRPTYDVKKVEGARQLADTNGWMPIDLGGSDALCSAARRATKTRSNIQNN